MLELTTGYDLRNWRERNRLSQKELAERTGYTITTISHLEYQNKALSKKLIDRIKALDLELHPIPQKDKITEKWESIDYYKNIFGDEMFVIEKAILELLTINVNKVGLDKTGAYLDFLGKSLKALTDLKNYSFQDDDSYKTDASRILTTILKEAKLYLKK